jgi:hypothetical protein
MSDAQKASWSKGPTLKNVQPVLEMLRTLLDGRLEIQDGIALEAGEEINISIRRVANVVRVAFLDPKPNIDLHYIVDLQRPLDGVKIFQDYIEIEIPGLPDPRFDIES